MARRAQYAGTCPSCWGRFAEGVPIRWHTNGGEQGGWGHDVCPDPVAVEHPPCPDCFLVHPPGTCDR